MAEQDRLRGLKVRVPRHQHVPVSGGLLDDGPLQVSEHAAQFFYLPQQVEPRVRRYLIVAAAPGVQLARYGPDVLAQPALDRGMNVFVAGDVLERTGLKLGPNRLQPGDDLLRLRFGQHPRPDQRPRIGLAASDVGRVQALIKANRRV